MLKIKNMKKIILSIQLMLVFFLLSAPAAAEYKNVEKINIITTTSQVGDLVENIAGDAAKVTFLMGIGVDPHLYQPTRSDISKLNEADVIFYNGMNLEGRMEELLVNLGKTQKTFSIADALYKNSITALSSDKGFDPHIWMDVRNWIMGGEKITAYLSVQYPEHAQKFSMNFDRYKGKLIGLDAFTKAAIGSIPESNKILVTAHDAFGYFGAAYGIEVVGIQGISTESEAGLRKIEETVDLLVERKIPAVFVESSVGDHNIRAIIEGAKARDHDVAIGGTLYSDAMGEPGTPEGTYIGMMLHNVKTITAALSGIPYTSGYEYVIDEEILKTPREVKKYGE